MSEPAIRRRWESLRAARRRALIPYLTAGYPTRATSVDAARMASDAGADFLEIGVPFSDPLADGPVIQHASQVALEQGMTVAGVLELVQAAALPVPVIAFSYLNPILAYGVERFLAEASDAGVHGLLLTDLPLGEDPELEATIRESRLARIPLVAPTTTLPRLHERLHEEDGFIYLIARLGVTGARTELGTDLETLVAGVRRATTLPVALGFGIRDGAQARQAARWADGVVVGSELVRRVGQGLDEAQALLGALRAALDDEGP